MTERMPGAGWKIKPSAVYLPLLRVCVGRRQHTRCHRAAVNTAEVTSLMLTSQTKSNFEVFEDEDLSSSAFWICGLNSSSG